MKKEVKMTMADENVVEVFVSHVNDEDKVVYSATNVFNFNAKNVTSSTEYESSVQGQMTSSKNVVKKFNEFASQPENKKELKAAKAFLNWRNCFA